MTTVEELGWQCSDVFRLRVESQEYVWRCARPAGHSQPHEAVRSTWRDFEAEEDK